MTIDPNAPPLDESALRRALRLDADEVPPRLDPALIAAAARASSRRGDELLVVAAVAFVAGWAWSAALGAILGGIIAATGLDPLAAAIDLATGIAVTVAPLVDIATTPAIPMAILAAAAAAVIFEGRGRTHAATVRTQ